MEPAPIGLRSLHWRVALLLALIAFVPWHSLGRAMPVAGASDRFIAGRLLVASEKLDDPLFARTVILMVRHNKDGAFGLIVNRRMGRLGMAEALRRLGMSGASGGDKAAVDIHFGGPVGKNAAFVVHSPDFAVDGTTVVNGHASVTTGAEVMRAIASGHGPANALIVFGYAGWASGQLEAELRGGSWVVAPSDSRVIFDRAYDTKWKRAHDRAGLDL